MVFSIPSAPKFHVHKQEVNAGIAKEGSWEAL